MRNICSEKSKKSEVNQCAIAKNPNKEKMKKEVLLIDMEEVIPGKNHAVGSRGLKTQSKLCPRLDSN